MTAARPAAGIGFGLDLGTAIGPKIKGKKGFAEPVRGTGEELKGLAGRDGGNGRRGCAHHSGCITGFKTPYGGGRNHARKAGSLRGYDVQRYAVTPYDSAIYPRHIPLNREIINEIASFEIIGSVENQVGLVEHCVDVRRNQVGDAGVHAHGAVEQGDLSPCRFGLGESRHGIGLVKEHLTLKVAFLDEIPVDQRESADTGAGEQVSRSGAGGAAADNSDMGCREPTLTLDANPREKHLTRIPFVQ